MKAENKYLLSTISEIEWALVLQVLDGRIQETDRLFQDWLAEKEENSLFYNAIQESLKPNALQHFEFNTEQQLYNIQKEISHKKTTWRRSWRLWRITAAAACLLFVTIGATLFFKSENNKNTPQISLHSTTPLDTIRLEDGSMVWLNEKSSLSLAADFGKKDRKVILHGEAYFEVAKDKTKPFIVQVDDANVRVTGTSFSIDAREAKKVITTTLYSGGIIFSTSKIADITLIPQQRIVYSPTTGKATIESLNRHITSPTWRLDQVILEDMPLAECMTILAEWNQLEVKYAEERLKLIPFNGTLTRSNSLEECLKMLEATKKVRLKLLNNEVYVMPAKQK